MSVAILLLSSVTGASARPFLPDPLVEQALAVDQLGLQLLKLMTAPADQLELDRDVTERLVDDPPSLGGVSGLGPLAPQAGPRGLGLEQLGELVERQPEQVTEPDDLANAIDVG